MYLFDTDVLSALAKQRRPEGLMARFAATPPAAQFTTAVNVAEICYGLSRLEAHGGAGASRDLFEFFEKQVFPRLTVLPFEMDDARAYGRLKASLERKGRPRFEPDVQIAAIALRHRLTVVTSNVRHFQGDARPAGRKLARLMKSGTRICPRPFYDSRPGREPDYRDAHLERRKLCKDFRLPQIPIRNPMSKTLARYSQFQTELKKSGSPPRSSSNRVFPMTK